MSKKNKYPRPEPEAAPEPEEASQIEILPPEVPEPPSAALSENELLGYGPETSRTEPTSQEKYGAILCGQCRTALKPNTKACPVCMPNWKPQPSVSNIATPVRVRATSGLPWMR